MASSLRHMVHSRSAFMLMVVALLLACGLGACESEGDGSSADVPDAEVVEEDAAAAPEYEVILTGAVDDTLRGRAVFGEVLESGQEEEYFVIALQDSEEMTGGMFLVQDPRVELSSGDYPVVREESSEEDGFAIRYREGMRRELDGVSGTVRLDEVRDSVIEGTFEVVLRGTLASPGQPVTEGEVRASGAFRAIREPVGFIVGL